jgi:hypothetical protein
MDEHSAAARTPHARTVIALGLVTAVLFELVTVLATQYKPVRAVSPWQDDPYDTVVSVTQFTVPVLAVMVAVRLVAWRAPGRKDRAQQLIRAVAVLLAMVTLTLGFEWGAVVVAAHRESWNGWTVLLIAALAMMSALAALLAALLARAFQSPAAGGWRHDWLGDLALLAAFLPGIRRYATGERVAWVRRHAMLVFAALSVLAGGAEISGMIIGEQWRDPVLISWAVLVATATDLTCCVIGNAVAGFIARPAPPPGQRVCEKAVVGGTLAFLAAVAFHDQIWGLFTRQPLNSAGSLAGLTLGPGLMVAIMTAVVASHQPQSPARWPASRRMAARRAACSSVTGGRREQGLFEADR